MKTSALASLVVLLLAQSAAVPLARAAPPSAGAPQKEQSIPFDQLGAEAQKQYKGDGIRIVPTKDGAQLKAIMQDLEAQATPEGLWITSTADEDAGKPNRFRVRAVEVGRVRACSACRASVPDATTANPHAATADSQSRPTSSHHLPPTGPVRASQDAAHWLRPGLIEQYSVSTDGVRQDFIITRRPARNGEALRVELDIHGAQAKKAPDGGAKLTLTATSRELAYTRLKVTDATGKELPAEMHVPAPDRLQVLVQDDFAVYPVCIDPTFSDADWVSMNPEIPGANDVVSALLFDSSGNLYVGGSFSVIVSVPANRIAKWNGSAWSALGSGMDNSVRALAVDSAGNLYAGGDFTTAGGVSSNYIAKWNGSAWSALGSGISPTSYGKVSALVMDGAGSLYAGGIFTTAGGVSVNHIARWDGSAWSALGSGMSASGGGVVSALALDGTGNLYAGGFFTTAGGVSASNIAKWNGSTWSALGSGINYTVLALAVDGAGNLYAGGRFGAAGGVSASNIAKWNGSAWSALGSGMWSSSPFFFAKVSALAVDGAGNLYAGGAFTTAGGVSASNIAKWNGSAWSALGSGLPADDFDHEGVLALAIDGAGNLYAGGEFTRADGLNGLNSSYIGKWSGTAWSALGSESAPLFGVSALALDSVGNLYVAGIFATPDGRSISRIAKWNGSSWSSVMGNTSGRITALVLDGAGNLYVAKGYDNSSGDGSVVKWNGSTWSSLSGMWSPDSAPIGVYALALDGAGNLYAGGMFTTAGGVWVNNIAKWDGSAWSALGSGISHSIFLPGTKVSALALDGTGNLYAGGYFDTAGGVSANHIAKWNGSAWEALSMGMNGAVNALAVDGDGNLYAGGGFTTAGGMNASRISKWNGSAWSSLGSGVNNSVHALLLDGAGHLYVGGSFITAGDKFSPYIARANLAGGDGDGDGLLDNWELTHWPTTTGHNPLDDSDHDGYEELLELAFGLNPTVSNPGNLPPVTEEGGYLTMTITKQPGVTYQVQTAGTLLPAQPDSFSAVSTTILTNNATTLKVRDNFPASSSARRFIRVQVTAAP